jgi:hypothetical protein
VNSKTVYQRSKGNLGRGQSLSARKRQSDETASWMMSEYDTLSKDDQSQLIEQLRSTISIDDRKHWCPVMGISIVSPCQLGSCEFRFNRESHMNCMVFKAKTKPIENIAMLLNCTTVQAREHAAEAVRQMRLAALQEVLSKKSINHYTMIGNTDVCVNCGAVIEKSSIPVHHYKYCSRACFVDKPPYVVYLEYKFSTDPRVVLRMAKEVFKTLTMISAVLKIQRSNLIKMYERYLGIQPVEWGLSVADIVDVLRKKKPSPSADAFITIAKEDEITYPHWAKFERDCRNLAKIL